MSIAQGHEWEPHLTEDASTCRRCGLTVENTLRAAGWDEELVKTPCSESPAAQGHEWADIRRAAQLGQGAVYVTTDVGDGQLFHVVLTRDRLEKLAGYDPGHNERDFPHAHLYVGGDDADS